MKSENRFVVFVFCFLLLFLDWLGPESNGMVFAGTFSTSQARMEVAPQALIDSKGASALFEATRLAQVAQPAQVEPEETPSPPPPVAPPAGPVRTGSTPSKAKGQGVVFKFDNADLYEVIRTMAEVLKISYVIDPRVRGTVNINTTGAIAQEDIYPLLLTILRMNGATMVKKDSIYEIVPLSEGKRLPAAAETKEDSSEDRFAIEIIKPNYIPISELEKVIKPFLSDEKEVVSFPQNNILIVADLLSNIKKIRNLVALFDIDIFTDQTIGLYPVVNSDATELAKDLERIFTSLEIPSKSGRGVGITFTPIARLNSVLVVSSIPGILDKVESWIRELDKAPTEESKTWVFVYYVQNAKAKDLGEVLKQVYAKGKETKIRPEEPKPAPTPTPPAPAPRTPGTGQPARPTTPSPVTPGAGEGAGGAGEGEINIVVDEANNALVVRSLYRDYRAILETIKKLDIYPKQVLIEVMLAEITLDDSLKYGLEWFRFISSQPPEAQEVIASGRPPKNPFDLAETAAAVAAGVAGGGIRYAIVALGERLSAAISAAAADNRLNVISSPHLLASNNKEAKIQIGQEEPIITQTYTSSTTTTVGSDILGQTIEYKDTGIIMTVTPRISDSGLITLEIQIEDSQVENAFIGSVNNLIKVPRFKKKTAKTTVSVLEGQIIVIGGLISDTKTANTSGIPFLSKMPVVGALFGRIESENSKTETILIMTPHIISDANQSRTVTDEFRQRVRGIHDYIERRERGEAPPLKEPVPNIPLPPTVQPPQQSPQGHEK
ncbi:MAG: type II secretion system secretin GspD [Desulfobacterales bacterium]|nr:type II secretion system secretin GspD [Desulfobacterales bacterium]